MAHKTDAITRWWRGTSLRAKVTGVTVALLAVGLIAAGVGTMLFLRNALLTNLETSVVELAGTDLTTSLFDIEVDGGVATFTPRDDAAPTDYFVAVYGPDGELQVTGGGDPGSTSPDFPDTFSLTLAQTRVGSAFTIPSSQGGAPFRAAVDVIQVDGVAAFYTQLVSRSTAPVNSVVTSFLGIYGVLALITIIGGALATRYLVTLTFRSLGQVESTAEAIASGDFSQRMTDIEPTTTEVGRLKTAINAMLGRIDAAIRQRDATVRQMRRFIGDASHELRTPLVTVRGYAELYRMGAIADAESTAQAMDRIESEAKRMGLLVEDLLALARLDEKRDVAITPVDLRPIARDAALDVRATSPARAVTVSDTTAEESKEDAAARPPASTLLSGKKSAPGVTARRGAPLSLLRRRPKPVPATAATGLGETAVPALPVPAEPASDPRGAPIVLGDENRVRQVVTNLLGNARRFTADDSPVDLRVGVDADAGMGWIEVIDHGEGVPDQIKDKIFQRFWRADTSRARETGGTGLGLSIVASIVEALHGTVEVLDTPGGGATFRVSLPLAHDADGVDRTQLETQPLQSVDLSRQE
jgi:two-component system OmpR family sensor kinase